MTLHQLVIFAKVAKLGSFTGAAEALRVRQPSISLQIKALERECDVKLFEKLGNKIYLTGAGEKLLEHAEEVVAKMEQIREEMESIKGLKRGRIVIGGVNLAVATFLPVMVQKFRHRHPMLNVVMKIRGTTQLAQALLAGEIDVAVLGRAPFPPHLVGELYKEEPVWVVASPNHPLSRKKAVSLEVVAGQPWIVIERGTIVRDLLEAKFAERGLQFKPIFEMAVEQGCRDAVKNLVMNGFGITVFARPYVISDIEAGRLKALRVPQFRLTRPLYVVTHKKRKDSLLVQTFIEFLKKHRDKALI